MKKYGKKNNSMVSGYGILELVFYIAFFAIFSLLSINAMVTMTKSFRETSIQGELVQSGTIIERMGREVRRAYGISSVNTGSLSLNSTDDLGANKTIQFLLSGSDVQFWENGILTGNLNAPNIAVDGLTFTQIVTAKSKAVKIYFSVRSDNDTLARVVDFYDTIVLRGSY